MCSADTSITSSLNIGHFVVANVKPPARRWIELAGDHVPHGSVVFAGCYLATDEVPID